jgi:hypothetical protein
MTSCQNKKYDRQQKVSAAMFSICFPPFARGAAAAVAAAGGCNAGG